MTSVFIETTVLTDYLLKRDGSETRAAAAFERFDRQILPQFSWKEFKRGPLKNFVWAHNKLADTKSFLETVAALQRMSRSPHRYITSTGIQAVHSAFRALFDNLAELRRSYGDKADPDRMLADALRLELKRIIKSLWKSRKTLFGGPYHILSCYPDAAIDEVDHRLEIDPRDCPKGTECCLKVKITGRRKDLRTIRAVLKSEAGRQEVARRSKVIRHLEKHPSSLMSRDDCRSFGDAYFVLFCPSDASILTTNMRDIEPMATAVGLRSESP